MKYNINQKDAYSLATIETKGDTPVTALITVDLHHKKTVSVEAIEKLYPEMLLAGCSGYSRDKLLDAINRLGAGLDISISDSVLTIQIRTRKEKFLKTLKLVKLILEKPSLLAKELKRIKTVAINELDLAKEDSRYISLQGLKNSLYQKGDRRHTSSLKQLISQIDKTNTSDIKTFHKKVIDTYWVCSIVSNGGVVSSFTRMIGGFRMAPPKINSGAHKLKTRIVRTKLTNIPSKANIDFSIGTAIPVTIHHPDFVALSFGVTVLGKWGGFSGRLMSTVREKEGLTYGIYSSIESASNDEQGYFRIMTFFAPEKSADGLKSTFRELSKLYKRGITKQELDKFKTILDTSQQLLQDSTSSQLLDLHIYNRHGFSVEEMLEYKARVSTLTIEQVNKAIKKYLDPSLMRVSGAGPTNENGKKIKNFLKTV